MPNGLFDAIVAVSQGVVAASGGKTAESLASIKGNANAYFSNRVHVYNRASVIAYLNSQPEVKQSTIWANSLKINMYITATGGTQTYDALGFFEHISTK